MKDCLIIGPAYVFHYNDVYPRLKDKVLKVGIWCIKWQLSKDKPNAAVGNWFTTLQVNRPEEKKLKLTKTYNENDYQRFDNAPDIIESKSKDIPIDYDGLIAVPITFFKYYDYLLYDILGKRGDLVLNGKQMFERLIIRRKQL